MTNLDALLTNAGKKDAPRILTLDIETSPNLVWSYSLWNTTINPDMVVEPSRILCFAAKWYGEKRVHYYGEETHGHVEMIEAARDLLDQADVVVTYNGKGFDEKHMNREFLMEGLLPPSPYKSIDLYQVVKSNFKFPSNRLGQIGDSLGIGTKIETGGWRMWSAVLAGDEKAIRLMRKYNIQDVVLTEDLLRAIGPWVKGLPHAGIFTGEMDACYSCGSTNLTRDGIAFTTVTVYPRFRCDDCGAWNKQLRNGQMRAV